jgi:hypothetical protein
MICQRCKKPCVRTSPSQKYCPNCSGEADVDRKRAWARGHQKPYDPGSRAQQMSALRERGALRSRANRAEMAWPARETPAIRRQVRVVVPFDYRWSKNAIHSMAYGNMGHVWVRKEANAMRDELTWELRGTGPWYQGPVWLDIFVEKPNQKGDAINVLELVADGVKEGIGVDDRWFSIKRLDWAIVKEEPRLYVGVGQAIEEDHQACSYCGAIKPLVEFARNRSTKNGRARRCLGCKRLGGDR